MLTGELSSQIDAIWNSFWTGGISNPMEVMEQITYLLFLRRLDDLHTLEENKSVRLGHPNADVQHFTLCMLPLDSHGHKIGHGTLLAGGCRMKCASL